MSGELGSHIIIDQEVDESLTSVLQNLKNHRVVTFAEDTRCPVYLGQPE